MRLKLPGLLTVLAVLWVGCANSGPGLPLEEVRGHLTSPKPLRYLTQTLGAGQSGDATPGGGTTLWYPLAPPDSGKRLVLRFGSDDRLARAEVTAAGKNGRYDVIDEVLFDRSNWKRATAPAPPQGL